MAFIGGWRIGLAAAFWAAGGTLIYRARIDRSSSWASSEHRMTRLLAPLTHHGHVVLADRALPGSKAHLDHLVIGPSGVILVDSKNWRHRRVITGDRGRIRVGHLPGRTAVRTAVFESGLVHQALAAELGRAVPVDAVLAIHGARLPNWRNPSVNGVPLMQAGKVRHWIQSRPAELSSTEVAQIADAAERVFPPVERQPNPGEASADHSEAGAAGRHGEGSSGGYEEGGFGRHGEGRSETPYADTGRTSIARPRPPVDPE